MSQTNASRNFRWTDLSHYGVHLNIFVQERQSILAILGSVTPEVKEKLEAMNFVRLPWGTYARKSMENPAQFLQSMKSYFPEARVLQEGDVCADGSIMRMADIVKNIRNQDVVREYGNPFNTQPPVNFVPEPAPEPALETEPEAAPVVAATEVAPPAPTPEPAPVQESTAQAAAAPTPVEIQPEPVEPVTQPTPQAPASAETTPEPTPVAAVEPATPAVQDNVDWVAYRATFISPETGELTPKGKRVLRHLEAEYDKGYFQNESLLDSADIAYQNIIMRANQTLTGGTDIGIGGIVPEVPTDAENRDSYKLVISRNRVVLGFVNTQALTPFTHGATYYDEKFIASDGTVFYNGHNNQIALDQSYGLAGLIANTGDNRENTHEFKRREILNNIRHIIVKPIMQTDHQPQTSLSTLARISYGLAPGESMSPQQKKEFISLVKMATGLYRANDESRLDTYNKLDILNDYIYRDIPRTGLPSNVSFAISRAINIMSLPVSHNIFINRDEDGALLSCIPASSGANIVVGADTDNISILSRYIPIGNENMSYEMFPPQNFENSKVQILNMVGLRNDTQVEVTIGETSMEVREDVADALRYLGSRGDDGQSIIMLDATKEESQGLLTELARHYHINSATEMTQAAIKRSATQSPVVAISVGTKRPLVLEYDKIPETDHEFSVSENARDVWSWSSFSIRRMSENLDLAMDTMSDGINRNEDNFNEANNFQEPYASLSHHGSPTTMSPKFQITPQRRFHATIIRELKKAGFDSVDEYAVHALGLPLEEINMSPEQIDMLATAFVRMTQPVQEGNAIMNADNTGVGKTRENCAIITAALREGMVATYITEFPAAFGAIYDEFRILKSNNLLRPLTINNNDIMHNGELIMPATPRHIIKGLTSRMLPPDYGMRMECVILTPEGSNIIRTEFLSLLEQYQDNHTNDEFMERYEAMKSLMEKYEGGQITLIGDERIEELLRFLPETEIRERITEYPDYNFVMGTYSQFNRPSTQYQKGRNRVSLVESYENPAPQGKRKPRIIARSPKADWMTQVVAKQENHIVTLDESHVAASDNSNIARNVMPLKDNAKWLIYSSATWLKGVKGMQLYSRLFSEVMPVENISAIMLKGDETIHETVTRMMVETGAYVRRELDTSDCTYNTIHDTKYFQRNVEYTNLLAPVRSAIAVYSNAIKARVSMLNDTIDNEQDIDALSGGNQSVKRSQKLFEGGDISSPLTRLEQTVDVIYIMDIVLDRAIEHLKNGRKPFIAIDGTNEGYIRSFYEKHNRIPNLRDLLKNIAKRITLIKHKGDYVDFAETIRHMDIADDILARLKAELPEELKPFDVNTIEDITEEMMNEKVSVINRLLEEEGVATFDEYLNKRIYDIAMDIKESNAYPEGKSGDMDYLYAMNIIRNAIPQYHNVIGLTHSLNNIESRMPVNPARQIKTIMDLIDKVPELPISALDHIREGIEKAGFTCGEITGRRFFIKDNKEMVQRDIRDKGVIRDMFNDGLYNAVLVNKAGASSLNMHASLEAKDKGVRVTQYCGVFPDANTYGQIAGRTHRNGAVSSPEYEVYNTGLPVTIRRLAIMAKKLRSMFALSTSNRDNSLIGSDVVDSMNSVGDYICLRYLEGRPELAERLGLEDKLAHAVAAKNEGRSPRGFIEAKSVMRLIDNLLPYHEQSKVLQEIETEYLAEIDELDAMGKNPLKQKELMGESIIRDRKLISGFENGGENVSVFSQPLYLSTLTTITELNPVSGEDMANLCENFERTMTETPAERADMLWERRDDILFDLKGLDKTIHVDDYIAGTANYIAPPLLKQSYHKLKALCSVLRNLEIGTQTETHYLMSGNIRKNNEDLDDGRRAMVITGIKMPDRDSLEAVSATNYSLRLLGPGDEKPIEERLSVRMRLSENGRIATGQSLENIAVNVPMSGLKSEDPTAFIEQFQRIATEVKKKNKTGQTNYVLTGNELAAINVGISAGDIGHIVSFKLQEGEDENGNPRMKQMRGYYITDMKKFNEYNTNIESPELAKAALEEESIGRLEFQSKPKTLVTRQKNGNYSISMPANSAEGSIEFFENPSILEFAEAHFGSLDEMCSKNSNARAKTKLVLKIPEADANIVSDFVDIMYQSRISCRYDPKHSDVVSTLRADINNVPAETSENAQAPAVEENRPEDERNQPGMAA